VSVSYTRIENAYWYILILQSHINVCVLYIDVF
jgi:hypothetical protein